MQKKWMSCLFLLLISICACTLSTAAVVKDLATADVRVDDRSQQALEAALPKALAQALVKISGNENIATVPAIANQLQNASQWMVGYSYKSQADGLLLSVNFNQDPLINLLRQTGQTIWGNDRPLTLVWYQIVPYQQSSELLVADSQYASNLQSSLADRGLVNMMPMGDLDDEALMTEQQAWPPKSAVLQSLRQRYGVEAINMAQIREIAPGQWQGSEILAFNNNTYSWVLSAATVPAIIENAVDNVADTMANQLAILQSKGLRQTLQLRVLGVNDMATMQYVMSYLQKLTAIDKLTLLGIGQNGLILNAETAGGREQLRLALARNRNLSLENTIAASDNGAANTVVLQWRG